MEIRLNIGKKYKTFRFCHLIKLEEDIRPLFIKDKTILQVIRNLN